MRSEGSENEGYTSIPRESGNKQEKEDKIMDTPITQSARLQPRASALLVLLAIAAVYVGITVTLRSHTPQPLTTAPLARVDTQMHSALTRQMAWQEGQNALTYTPATSTVDYDAATFAQRMDSLTYHSFSAATVSDIAAVDRQIEWLEWFNALTYDPTASVAVAATSAHYGQQAWVEWFSSLTYDPAASVAGPTGQGS